MLSLPGISSVGSLKPTSVCVHTRFLAPRDTAMSVAVTSSVAQG